MNFVRTTARYEGVASTHECERRGFPSCVRPTTDGCRVWSELCPDLAAEGAVRSPDPFLAGPGRWVMRRLAPGCTRIELADPADQRDAVRLVRSMGFETANVHLGTGDARALLRDVKRRRRPWLRQATLAMVGQVDWDWSAFRGATRSRRRAERSHRRLGQALGFLHFKLVTTGGLGYHRDRNPVVVSHPPRCSASSANGIRSCRRGRR
jgi:hypothetical protein